MYTKKTFGETIAKESATWCIIVNLSKYLGEKAHSSIEISLCE